MTDPDFKWTDEARKGMIIDTVYEGKICFCEGGYKAEYLVDDFYNDKRLRSVMPEPPPCRNCKGWPKHNLHICPKCDTVYYAWFFTQTHPIEHKLCCWDCSIKYGQFNPTGRFRTAPPKSVLPVQESFAELAAKIRALDF